MSSQYTVLVTKFDQYNPKAAGKKILWSRIDSTLFSRSEFAELSAPTKLMWFWVLSQACMNPSREVVIGARVMHDIGARTSRALHESIVSLVSLGWIQLLSEKHDQVKSPYERTNGRTNERTLASAPTQPVRKPTQPPLARDLTVPAKDSNPVMVYCDCYKSRYGHSPEIGGKQAGILARVFKSHGGPKYRQLIEGYFSMPSVFLTERSHPVELIEGKVNEVFRYLATGKVVTKADTQKMNEKLDEAMGPRPPSIAEILAQRENQGGAYAKIETTTDQNRIDGARDDSRGADED